MLNVDYEDDFLAKILKIKDASFKERVKKLVDKIIADPEVGKPMRYERKDTREVYIGSFRLSYAYFKEKNSLIFLNIYHKDEQ